MDHGSNHTMVITLCAAISAGIFFTIIARRLNLPAIILLLAGGVALGPVGLNIVRPESLGDFLPVVVALAVGLILFEGGLTLDFANYRKGSRVIQRLLTVGVLVTWILSAFFIWLIFRPEIEMALLCGSLVIVTGPTVIGPLLKRMQLNSRLHAILHWEGVLIDSIGVFIALLCFEWLVGRSGEQAMTNFGLRTWTGLAAGVGGGLAIGGMLRTKFIPENMRNSFALACAVTIFGATEAIISEAGLLAVTVAGLVVGWKQPIGLKQVREFKAEIADLLIGLLFILLSARLRPEQFQEFGWPGVAVVALVMLVARPINVLVSSRGTDLTRNEKLFLAWVAPRGIVAASMSSLFAIALTESGAVSHPRLLETFTYSVIVGTVLLQGMTAGLLAKVLDLKRPETTGWLIIGAHPLARRIARFIQEETKLTVLLLDSNARLVKQAQDEGLPAFCADALDTAIVEDRPEFQKVGFLLALTDNTELNELLCHRWGDLFGRERVYRWSAVKGDKPESDVTHGTVVFADLPRPSVASNELAENEAELETVVLETKTPPESGQLLLVARNGQLSPVNTSKTEAFKSGDRLLVLKRDVGNLSDCFGAGDVMDFVTQDLVEVFTQIERALHQRFEALSKEQLWDLSLGAEHLLLPLPGKGTALAHTHSTQLKQRLCVLARFPTGLEIPSQAERIRLLFLLISPADDPGGHLATLAEFGRFCSQPSNLQKLKSFEKPSEALSYLRKQKG
ncbi:MAG TPA: cation:proton antiporter [Verrucomicrobiae bacterium]